MSMISTIAGPIARYITGETKPRNETVAGALPRGEDSVVLSPESQALAESISQNQNAAASLLREDDALSEQTLAALAALNPKSGQVASLIG